MKKTLGIILAVLLALTSLGAGAMAEVVIGWHGVEPHPFIEQVQSGVKRWAAENPDVKVLETISVASSTQNQAADTEAMISDGAQYIIVYPADASAINSLTEEYNEYGVEVICYGAEPTKPTPTQFTVGTDITAAAKQAAEALIQSMGGKGKILNVLENLYDPNTLIRKNAIEEVVAGYPDVEIVMEIADMGTAEEAVEKISSAIGALGMDVQGIICTGSTTSIGCAMVLSELIEDAGENRIHAITLDTDSTILEAIRLGAIDGTIAENPSGIGYLTCVLSKALADGYQKANEDVYFINAGCALVTTENIDAFADSLSEVTQTMAGEIFASYLVK